jgi:hypothetical protein
MKKECKGCSLIRLSFVRCDFALKEEEELCPCIECLVKPMCEGSCDKRQEIKRDKLFLGIRPFNLKGRH